MLRGGRLGPFFVLLEGEFEGVCVMERGWLAVLGGTLRKGRLRVVTFWGCGSGGLGE